MVSPFNTSDAQNLFCQYIEFSVDSFYIQFHAYARQNRMWILSRKSTPAKSRGRPLRLSGVGRLTVHRSVATSTCSKLDSARDGRPPRFVPPVRRDVRANVRRGHIVRGILPSSAQPFCRAGAGIGCATRLVSGCLCRRPA